MKKVTVLVMVFVCILSMGLSAEEKKAASSTAPKKEAVVAEKKEPAGVANKAEKVFTLDELAKFDGKEGRPAYVAAEGQVYDVTGVPVWASGEHKGGKVGTDISDKIKLAPHGKGILSKRTKVGVLAGQDKGKAQPKKAVEGKKAKEEKKK